jgi:integrase
VLDPLRVLFRRAVRRDQFALDPTRELELPAVRGQRDRIESPENAQRLLDALPDDQRALWTVAMFAGLRRGELLGLRWADVDFDGGVIRVERGWDMYAGAIAAKSTAGVRGVPMAFPVRRELRELKLRGGPRRRRPRVRPDRQRAVLPVDSARGRVASVEGGGRRVDHAARGAAWRDMIPAWKGFPHYGKPGWGGGRGDSNRPERGA